MKNKAANDELLDLVNEKDEVIGTVWKSEAHKDPKKIHRQVDLIIFNNKGEVLLQQRGLNKKVNPGKWANSVSGHVQAGESPDIAVLRELKEELGINAVPIFFKKVLNKKRKELRFIWIYYTKVNGHPKLNIDKKEVVDWKWIRPEKLALFAEEYWWDINGLSHKLITELNKKGLI